VFRYNDGSTSAFRPNGTIGPDGEAYRDDYFVILDRLDDGVLKQAEAATGPRFVGSYNATWKNCQHYAMSVLGEYNSLVNEAQRLYDKCRAGDPDACRSLRNRCNQGAAPEDICRQYEADKKAGILPAHRSLDLQGIGGLF